MEDQRYLLGRTDAGIFSGWKIIYQDMIHKSNKSVMSGSAGSRQNRRLQEYIKLGS